MGVESLSLSLSLSLLSSCSLDAFSRFSVFLQSRLAHSNHYFFS